MRVVLDTNIIVSSFLTSQGRVARILDLWEQGAFDLITSNYILGEYGRVLRYPRLRKVHRLDDAQLAEIDEAFGEFSDIVDPSDVPTVIKDDPDDDHILAAADTGAVDCIVSGDPHLLELGSYKGIPIHSPADFLDGYFPDQTGKHR